MRRWSKACLAMVVAVLAAAVCVAQEKPGPPPPAAPTEITPETEKAIEKGLAYLASVQAADGSWNGMGDGGSTGITALAGLAFLAGGHVPGQGKYGANVERATQYILKNVRRDGFITSGNSRMYEHGFATLFLAEVYGMTGRADVKVKLKMAIRLIEGTQNPQGGWRYDPVPVDADISVTICQIMALRAARNAGIQVSKRVIDGGVKYVKSCQNADGGFSYQPTQGMGGSGFARTAAGVCSLYYAGEYEGDSITKGINYLYSQISKSFSGEALGHFHYGHYYAVQAMFQAGGKYWEAYYPRVRDYLVRTQQPNGSWAAQGFMGNMGAYPVAMSCIILQVPYRYLPILQR